MHFIRTVQPNLTLILGSMLVLVLLLAVACGSSAPAQPQQDAAPAQPQQDAAPAPSGGSTKSDSAPAAAPKPKSEPVIASPDVHPGTVTWMVGSFANERMTYCLAGGGGLHFRL